MITSVAPDGGRDRVKEEGGGGGRVKEEGGGRDRGERGRENS